MLADSHKELSPFVSLKKTFMTNLLHKLYIYLAAHGEKYVLVDTAILSSRSYHILITPFRGKKRLVCSSHHFYSSFQLEFQGG